MNPTGLDSQRPFCKACGLHKPCTECGKPRLSIVPLPSPEGAERTFTRAEALAYGKRVREACAVNVERSGFGGMAAELVRATDLELLP